MDSSACANVYGETVEGCAGDRDDVETERADAFSGVISNLNGRFLLSPNHQEMNFVLLKIWL